MFMTRAYRRTAYATLSSATSGDIIPLGSAASGGWRAVAMARQLFEQASMPHGPILAPNDRQAARTASRRRQAPVRAAPLQGRPRIAARRNPVLQVCCESNLAAGKTKVMALTVVARRLATTLDAIIPDSTPGYTARPPERSLPTLPVVVEPRPSFSWPV
jgi:hypothetical protein